MAYELNETTDFHNNAIAIDPSGCGCTDCLVGDSIPADSYRISDLLDAALNGDREIINRNYTPFALYSDTYGNGALLGLYGPNDFTVLPVEDNDNYRYNEASFTEILVVFPEYTPRYVMDAYEGLEVIEAKDESESLTELLDEKLAQGVRIVNAGDRPLIYGKTHAGTYSFYEVPTAHFDSIQILGTD